MAHENVDFSDGNYKTRSSKLADEIAKFGRSYSYLRLAAACSKIAELA